MADRRFFKNAGPVTLGRLAALTGSELSDASLAQKSVLDVAPLQVAQSEHVSFLDNKKYVSIFRETRAGACFVRPEFVGQAPAGTVCLVHKNPYKAYALGAQAFYPPEPAVEYRAHTAVIDPSAEIGKNCHIDHGAIVGRNVKIGEGCRIGAYAFIGEGVQIGAQCDIGVRVYLSHSEIGSRVRIYPGAVIGRAGFGFAIDPAGYISVPQLGRVIIGDDVEIGANTTIDRGAGPDTVIGQGCRIDNLVQIGHNVRMGKYCVIVSQTGISGSTQLGDYVMAGGQSGFAGHLNIGSGAKIAGQTGVIQDVPAGAEVMGLPAVPIKQFMRQATLVSKMASRKGSDKE